jgi:predicted NUDIX family NTP pyrophosphohydrolase
MAEQIHLVSGALVYKSDKKSGELFWFLVKENDVGGWEVPKSVSKNGESSVRSAIRTMGERGGMRVKVLEEVGRHGGAARVGNKVMTQRVIYYLIAHKEGDEVLGYAESEWVEHSLALRRVTSKRDREMLKSGRVLLNEIRAKRRKEREAEKAKEKAVAAAS